MALWWLYGYVFQVVVKPDILTFQVKFDLGGQGQSPFKTIWFLTKVFWISGPNLVILAWMGDELWCRQIQNRVIFWFSRIFDIEGKGQLIHKTIGTLAKFFFHLWSKFSESSLNGPELSCGQTSDWHTDWHTHGHTHIRMLRQYPKAKLKVTRST